MRQVTEALAREDDAMSGLLPTTSASADALTHVGRKAARQVTPHLRKSALELGWPIEVARSLRARYTDSGLEVRYPSRLKSHVEDLEYGTEDRAPLPAIRRFQNHGAAYVDLARVAPSLVEMLEGSQ